MCNERMNNIGGFRLDVQPNFTEILRNPMMRPNDNIHSTTTIAMNSTAQVMPSFIYIDPSIIAHNGIEYTASIGDTREVSFSRVSFPTRELTVEQWAQNVAQMKKTAKIKKATPKQVAKAIVTHAKHKAVSLKQQTQVLDAELTNAEQHIERQARNLAKSRIRVGYYKKRQASLEKDQKTLAKEFEETIIDLKQDERIADITIDDNNRILITTACLLVRKDTWESDRPAGAYQIRIDFSKNSIRNGVRVLNITKRMDDHYDSPTISNTYCCWGNIGQDITTDFKTGDLTELVQDMLEYIASPNDNNGFIGMEGMSNKGWEKFLSSATPMEDGFSWEQYDVSHEEEYEDDSLERPVVGTHIGIESIYSEREDSPQAPFENAYLEARRQLDRTERAMHQLRQQHRASEPQTPNELRLYLTLQWMELDDSVVRFAFEQLKMSSISRMNIHRRGENDILLMAHSNDPLRSTDTPAHPSDREIHIPFHAIHAGEALHYLELDHRLELQFDDDGLIVLPGMHFAVQMEVVPDSFREVSRMNHSWNELWERFGTTPQNHSTIGGFVRFNQTSTDQMSHEPRRGRNDNDTNPYLSERATTLQELVRHQQVTQQQAAVLQQQVLQQAQQLQEPDLTMTTQGIMDHITNSIASDGFGASRIAQLAHNVLGMRVDAGDTLVSETTIETHDE